MYVWSHVRWMIYVVGPGLVIVQTPRRSFPCDGRQRKFLDIAIDEVSGLCLCMRRPRPYRLIVVLAGVTILLGLHNPPCSWTSMMDPSIHGFTIAPCVDSLLCYRLIRRPKSILQGSPKVYCTYMHFAHLYISSLTLT
jgi:hypothetical protein